MVSLHRLKQQTESEHLRRVTELWSRDAGAYYCNEIYYRTLNAVRGSWNTAEETPLTPVLFIHLPTPDDELGLGDMQQAVVDILSAVVESAELGA